MSRLVVVAGVGGLAVATAVACGSFGGSDDDEPAIPSEAGTDAPLDVASNDDASTDGGGGSDADAGKFVVEEVTTKVDRPFYMTLAVSELVVGRRDDIGGVYRVPKKGGDPTKIGTRPAWGILVDGTTVYYCDATKANGTLVSVSLAGNDEKSLLPEGQYCLELALGGDGNIYFTSGDRSNSVEKYIDAGPPVVLRAGNNLIPEGIAADDEALYYAGLHEHAVVKIPFGGSYDPLDDNRTGEPRRVAIDDTYVYWVEHNSKEVRRVKKDGTGAGTMATGPAFTDIGGIAVDATHVYWVASGNPGGLYRVDKNNGGPYEALVENLNQPVDVVVDPQSVYVTVYGENRIIRIAKR